MQFEWWHAGGLLMGLLAAPYFIVNQHFKVEPRLLMIWRGLGSALLLAPVLAWAGEIPQDKIFYLASIGAGCCIAAFDRFMFTAAATYGAGVTSRLTALCVPLAFLFWLGLHPEHLFVLQGKAHIALLPLALAGSIASALVMKRDPLSRNAVIGLLPVYFLGATIDVFNKTAMQHASGLSAFATYGIITALLAGGINLCWPTKGGQPISRKQFFSPTVMLGGGMIMCITATYVLIKASSLASAPNPALVGALNLTAPFWVMMWNLWRKHPDNTNIWAGFGCVGSALLLVFATL